MEARKMYADLFRLTAIAAQTARIETTAVMHGRPVPPELPGLVSEAHAALRTLRLEVGAEQARRRFVARHGGS